MMFHNESERSLGKGKSRRWRHGTGRVLFLLAAALALATCAWLSMIFSSRHNCWHAIQEWQGSPLSFPWEPSEEGQSSSAKAWPHNHLNMSGELSLRNIVFGIAGSAQLWPKRKEYVKLWWRPREMRGYIWLEEPVEQELGEPLPPIMVSEDIGRFRYTNPTGHPSGVRIARIVQETFKLNLRDVQWFVMGDDDTVFSPDNLLRILKKYDPGELYYIGNPSESHLSNTLFSHGMAFGGAGIAISYPLAETLSRMLDECLERYPSLFGSDDRLHACITELGVPLTREPGFHQFDVHGNAFGLLAAHPITPFISMHHMDEVDPCFPKYSALDGLRLLTRAMQTEPSSFLQRCTFYDRIQRLSFSISLGYAVQVYPYLFLPLEIERPEITFTAWNSRDDRGEFDLDARKALKSSCEKPFLFFLEEIHAEEENTVVSIYKRDTSIDDRKWRSFCFSNVFSPDEVQHIRVVSKPMTDHWFLVPRRQCCKSVGIRDQELGIKMGPCQRGKSSSS